MNDAHQSKRENSLFCGSPWKHSGIPTDRLHRRFELQPPVLRGISRSMMIYALKSIMVFPADETGDVTLPKSLAMK
jgi:hypothetical protein